MGSSINTNALNLNSIESQDSLMNLGLLYEKNTATFISSANASNQPPEQKINHQLAISQLGEKLIPYLSCLKN